MKKITKYPAGVEADIPALRETFLRDYGLNREAIDRTVARQAVIDLYASNGYDAPAIYFLGSPAGCLLARSFLSQMYDQMSGQMSDQMMSGQMRDQMSAQMYGQMIDQMYGQMIGQMRAQMYGQMIGQMRGQMRDIYQNIYFWGGQDCYWLATYDLARRCGVKFKNEKQFEAYLNYSRTCGWMFAYPKVAFVSDRPSVVHFDNEKRLHCENGPSIAFRDGWALYHWHGISIPEEWVTGKPPTAKEALTWQNIEQRRAAAEIVGWQNILSQLNAKVIDQDVDPEVGTLLEAEIPDSGKERFIQVKCGTGRTFCLPVPRECRTALEANLWTYGFDADRNFLPEVRT